MSGVVHAFLRMVVWTLLRGVTRAAAGLGSIAFFAVATVLCVAGLAACTLVMLLGGSAHLFANAATALLSTALATPRRRP